MYRSLSSENFVYGESVTEIKNNKLVNCKLLVYDLIWENLDENMNLIIYFYFFLYMTSRVVNSLMITKENQIS